MISAGVKLQAFQKARRSRNEDYIRFQQGLDYSFAGNLSDAQKFLEKGAGNINGRRGTVPVIMEMWANDQVNRPTLGAVIVKLNSIRMECRTIPGIPTTSGSYIYPMTRTLYISSHYVGYHGTSPNPGREQEGREDTKT